MRKFVGVALVAVLVVGLGSVGFARMGGPGMGGSWQGMQGMGPGGGPCMGQPGAAPTSADVVDEGKARKMALDYAQKNFPGYQVEKLVKFDRPRGAMYQVELKGPKGEVEYLHINPFGGVRAFGPGRTL